MSARRGRPQRGLSLVELLVAIVISSLLAIAVGSVLAGFEGRRRSSTSINDINQSGNYAAWVLDTLLRNAGSGFAQTADYGFGCKLVAARSDASASSSAASSSASRAASSASSSVNTTILPAPAALGAPFASISRSFRLAPALIVSNGSTPGDSGAGSDVLVLMGGAAGRGGVPIYLNGYPATSALPLKNTLAFAANDLLLLVDPQVSASSASSASSSSASAAGSALAPCMITQVSGSFTEAGSTSLALDGSYYKATIDSRELTAYTSDAVVLNLGNVASGNPPLFNLIGVGDNSTLYAYDLLRTSSTPLQAIAAGVFELHALYGLDTNGDGRVDSWSAPTGSYSYATLSAGTTAAAAQIAQIRAIRVGLILRTALREKEDVSPASLTLFSDLGEDLSYSPSLSGDNTRYRYRTVEFTVPLRNPMMVN